MHLVPFSGPKNDVFRTPKSIKFGSKTRSETKMFVETVLVRFCSDFGPLGAPSGAQNRTQNRARAGPGLPGPHLGVALASSERHLSLTKALVVALGPFLAPILAHWASFWTLRAPFWTLRDSILDPPGLRWGPSGASFWIFLLAALRIPLFLQFLFGPSFCGSFSPFCL